MPGKISPLTTQGRAPIPSWKKAVKSNADTLNVKKLQFSINLSTVSY